MRTIFAIVLVSVSATSALAGWFDWAFGRKKCIEQIPIITASPTSVAFGNVSTGSNRSQAVVLRNSGKGFVNISTVTTTGTGYSVSENCGVLTHNQTCTATVSFAPSAAGTSNGTLTVASNQLANKTVALSGAGVSYSTSFFYG